jgi:hypothetical protein
MGAFLFAVKKRWLTLTMLKKLLLPFITVLLFSCSNSKKTPTADIDVATAFIRDILDNNFAEAEQFLLKDDMSQQYFDRFKQNYTAMPKEELEKYKTADIVINRMDTPNDSTRILNYSNTYKRDSIKLKLVWVNGKWFVDLGDKLKENQ